jgi:hypothetical protein
MIVPTATRTMQMPRYRIPDIHVSRLSRENTLFLTRAAEERARTPKPDSQLACVPYGGGPCFLQDRTSICCLEPERPSQMIEFVFAASPETIRREPQGQRPSLSRASAGPGSLRAV